MLGAAFAASPDEVGILGEWQLPPPDLASVLLVARRARVSQT